MNNGRMQKVLSVLIRGPQGSRERSFVSPGACWKPLFPLRSTVFSTQRRKWDTVPAAVPYLYIHTALKYIYKVVSSIYLLSNYSSINVHAMREFRIEIWTYDPLDARQHCLFSTAQRHCVTLQSLNVECWGLWNHLTFQARSAVGASGAVRLRTHGLIIHNVRLPKQSDRFLLLSPWRNVRLWVPHRWSSVSWRWLISCCCPTLLVMCELSTRSLKFSSGKWNNVC